MKFLDIRGVQILWNNLKSKFFNILNKNNYYDIMNSNSILINFPSNTVVRKICNIDEFASYYIIIINQSGNQTSAYIHDESVKGLIIPMTTVIDDTNIYSYAFIVLPNVDERPNAFTNESWNYAETN